jgi:hypothetical protein
MANTNPTVASANADTGLAPLNSGPDGPQPPQHDPLISDPTIDQVPPALAKLQAPYEPFVLALGTGLSGKQNNQSVDPARFPGITAFQQMISKGLYPEGPVRAEEVDVSKLEGHRAAVKAVEGLGETKAYGVSRGAGKAEVFVVALDVDQERVVGVKFPEA